MKVKSSGIVVWPHKFNQFFAPSVYSSLFYNFLSYIDEGIEKPCRNIMKMTFFKFYLQSLNIIERVL